MQQTVETTVPLSWDPFWENDERNISRVSNQSIRRSTVAISDVLTAILSVLLNIDWLTGRLTFGHPIFFCSVRLSFSEQPLQHRPAPTATSTGSLTLTQLAGSTRFLNTDKVDNFSLAYMEAKTKFVVEIHNQVEAERLSRDGNGDEDGVTKTETVMKLKTRDGSRPTEEALK